MGEISHARKDRGMNSRVWNTISRFNIKKQQHWVDAFMDLVLVKVDGRVELAEEGGGW